jgi:hypothetical protein
LKLRAQLFELAVRLLKVELVFKLQWLSTAVLLLLLSILWFVLGGRNLVVLLAIILL